MVQKSPIYMILITKIYQYFTVYIINITRYLTSATKILSSVLATAIITPHHHQHLNHRHDTLTTTSTPIISIMSNANLEAELRQIGRLI